MENKELLYSDITSLIIKAFYKVYNHFGVGFAKEIYKKALLIEFANLGLNVAENKVIKIVYDKKELGEFQLEIIVNDSVLVEIETIDKMTLEQDERKMFNHLKLSTYKVGLVLNFGKTAEFYRRENIKA